jgi:hypothetical protein
LSTTELIKVRSIVARALSVEDVNDPGRTTGHAGRRRTVTPHRLFRAVVSGLGGAQEEWTFCANLHAARTCLLSTEPAAYGPGWPP